jgi:hypothetical protein
MHGGAIIALADGQSQGVEWTANPRQWGAWRAYLSKRKISIKFMDARGKEGKCWTVPAAWPHDFDGDATLQEDQQAADWFMRNYRPERIELASAAQRAITATAYRKWAKEARPKDEMPDVPQKPELKYNDYDELLANYAKDMAAMRERTKRT